MVSLAAAVCSLESCQPSLAQYHNTTIIPQYLDEQAAVHSNAGGAIVVQPPAVAPPLIGVQVHTAGFGRRAAY